MGDKFYILAINEKDSFKTSDGKTICKVLMCNANLDNMQVGSDWATAYLLSDQVDFDAVYVPHFVQQRDGSYKRKFRKEGE